MQIALLVILLSGLILPIGWVALEDVCAYSMCIRLVFSALDVMQVPCIIV